MKSYNEMAEVFDKAATFFENEVGEIDMGKIDIDNNECATVGCVGGWLAIYYKGYGEYNYIEGANKFAEDLGFTCPIELTAFFEDRPDLWNNVHGGSMFDSRMAYGIKHSEKITCFDVSKHYRKVASHLRYETTKPKRYEIIRKLKKAFNNFRRT